MLKLLDGVPALMQGMLSDQEIVHGDPNGENVNFLHTY